MFQYFIIVFLLFVTMLIGGVLGYVFRAKVLGTVEQEMKNSMHVYDKKAIKDAWDTTQRTVSLIILFINSTSEFAHWLVVDQSFNIDYSSMIAKSDEKKILVIFQISFRY